MSIQTLDLNFTQMQQPNTFTTDSLFAVMKYCAGSIEYLFALNLAERYCWSLFVWPNSSLVAAIAPSVNKLIIAINADDFTMVCTFLAYHLTCGEFNIVNVERKRLTL